MSEIKVEILLPNLYNEDKNGQRKEVEGKKYSDTFNDLIDKFQGCTIDNSPLLGGWIDPVTKKRVNDENTTYWIVCEETPKNLEFLEITKRYSKNDFNKKIL